MNPLLEQDVTKRKNVINAVFYGVAGSVLEEGTAVCFPAALTGAETGQAATDAYASRANTVQKPSQSNNLFFAGVVGKRAVTNQAGMAVVEVHRPGSYTRVYVKEANSTLGAVATMIVGGDDAGKFTTAKTGRGGRGCVRLLQTNAAAGLVLAEVMEGEESGGIEFITAPATGGSFSIMESGITVLESVNLGTSGSSCTLAPGSREGMEKAFYCEGTMGSGAVKVNVTNGLQANGSTALASISFDAANETASVVTTIGKVLERLTVGATKASS